MGMIRCPTHGLTHITTCCPHIGDAVDTARYEHAQVRFDRSRTFHVLCDRCIPQALGNGGDGGRESGYLDDVPPVEPYCHEHLIDWYRISGQGDLSEAIAQSRASLRGDSKGTP